MLEVGKGMYGDFVTRPGVAFVLFGARWCGPCRSFEPMFAGVADELMDGDCRFATCDVDVVPSVASAESVISVPTVVAYKEGQRFADLVGLVSKTSLRSFVDGVRGGA